jgi:hypothetical protein
MTHDDHNRLDDMLAHEADAAQDNDFEEAMAQERINQLLDDPDFQAWLGASQDWQESDAHFEDEP